MEQGLEKKNMSQIQNKAVKRPFSKMNRGDPIRPIGAPLAKQTLQLPPSADSMRVNHLEGGE